MKTQLKSTTAQSRLNAAKEVPLKAVLSIFFTNFVVVLAIAVAQTAYAGIAEISEKWPGHEVRVCWLESRADLMSTWLKLDPPPWARFKLTSFGSFEKMKIRRLIGKEFTSAKTGIVFTGWQSCGRDPSAQAVLFKVGYDGLYQHLTDTTGFKGVSEIGSGLSNLRITSEKKEVLRSYLGLFEFDEHVIVHEFGHLAGLRHEHLHDDAGEDWNCWDYASRVFGKRYVNRQVWEDYVVVKRGELIGPFTKILTAYDPRSVMNPCWINQRNLQPQKVWLSPLDQASLKKLYAN